jgi:hypothetical protein
VNFEVQDNAREIAVQLEAKAKVGPTLLAALERVGARLHRDIVNEKLSGGGILEPRTGNLKRAVFHRVEAVSDTLASVGLGFDLSIAPYGRIQELGGVITPKIGAALAIPLEAMQTAKGVARGTAREVKDNPEAFGYTGTFIRKGVIFGRLSLYGKLTKDQARLAEGNIVPLFVLKTSVTLEAREPMQSTLANDAEWAAGEIGGAISAGFGGTA